MPEADKPKQIFLLSHMRSRSTALAHVLGSNPEVRGYYERHKSYLSSQDLLDMQQQLDREAEEENTSPCRYYFDKLLHNKARISLQEPSLAESKFIILLREPESTMQSIIHMGLAVNAPALSAPKVALMHYSSRLAYLESFVGDLGADFYFIESDSLIDHTDEVLHGLTEWLGLAVPLVKEYQIFPHTGKRICGDPFENIKSGLIQRTKGHTEIQIPPDTLEKGLAAYRHCNELLSNSDKNAARAS